MLAINTSGSTPCKSNHSKLIEVILFIFKKVSSLTTSTLSLSLNLMPGCISRCNLGSRSDEDPHGWFSFSAKFKSNFPSISEKANLNSLIFSNCFTFLEVTSYKLDIGSREYIFDFGKFSPKKTVSLPLAAPASIITEFFSKFFNKKISISTGKLSFFCTYFFRKMYKLMLFLYTKFFILFI